MTKAFGIVPFAGNGSARSSGKPAATFPGAVAGDAQLAIAVDREQTRLALPLSDTATSMTVENAAGLAVWSLLSIENEIVQVNNAVSGNVVPIQRGFDGTTPALHLTGATVSGLVDAYHHNTLVAEVEAIEMALGPNLNRIPAVPFLVSNNYDFPAQTPGVNLVAGNNVITLSPVPAGVNGSDLNHYLYISGGTGTAEPVLITGGSAVSGAGTGSLFVNCANPHSGAWTIRSATAGIQEAVNLSLAGNGRLVYIPEGSHVVYAPITTYSPSYLFAPIHGAGASVTTISPAATFPTLDISPASAVFIANCGPNQPTTAFSGPTFAGFSISFSQPWGSITSRSQIKQWRGFDLSNTRDVLVRDVIIAEAWNGITWVGTWSAGAWAGYVGRGEFDNVGIGSYNVAIQIDGMLDSGRFLDIHFFPYGNWAEYIYQPQAIGFQVGRADDLSITGGLSIMGKAMQFVAGADGNASFTLITGFGFDTFQAIDMPNSAGFTAGGHNVNLTNCAISFSPTCSTCTPANYRAISINRGGFVMTGGYVSAAGFTTPPIVIDDTTGSNTYNVVAFEGVTFGNNGVTNVKFFQQVNEPNAYIDLRIQNCQYIASPPQLTFTAPAFSIEQTSPGSAVLAFTGNSFNAINVGATALSIVTDDFHRVANNRIPSYQGTTPWGMSFPSPATLGYYEKAPNLIYSAKGFTFSGPIISPLPINYIAVESGANNAIVANLVDSSGNGYPITPGLIVSIKLAHTLQAGPNTLTNNAGPIPIRSHNNPANNIASPYAVGAVITLLYDGSVYQDLSQ